MVLSFFVFETEDAGLLNALDLQLEMASTVIFLLMFLLSLTRRIEEKRFQNLFSFYVCSSLCCLVTTVNGPSFL